MKVTRTWPEIAELQDRIGVQFRDVALLREAMTHRSYTNEHSDEDVSDSERLEFLGDAVLGYLAAEMVFRRFPDAPEGELTPLRIELVRTEALAELAGICDLGSVLRMGRGEEATGGRTKPSNLCNAFEALVGALLIDQGLDAVRDFALPLLEEQLSRVQSRRLDKDSKSLLQEWSQTTYSLVPEYRIIAETGPGHNKTYTVEVAVGGETLGSGQGRSKQAAEKAAARDALDRMQASN